MGWHLHAVFFQNGVCICSCCIENECKAVQWPSFRLYSCWTIARNKICNIKTAFCVVIECVNLWLPSFVLRHSDIIMHRCQHNHILVSTLHFIYIRYQHQIIIFTKGAEGGSFIMLVCLLYFSWNTFPIESHGNNNGNVSFWTPLS